MPHFKDYTGDKFGRLTAIELDNPPRQNKVTYWVLKCDCGEIVSKPICRCVDGSIQSCGCLRQEHYKYNNPLQGKNQIRFSAKDLEKINDLLAQGETKTAIASKFKCSRNTLNKYLQNPDLIKQNRRHNKKVLQIIANIQKLAEKKYDVEMIAKQLDLSVTTIRVYASQNKISIAAKKKRRLHQKYIPCPYCQGRTHKAGRNKCKGKKQQSHRCLVCKRYFWSTSDKQIITSNRKTYNKKNKNV